MFRLLESDTARQIDDYLALKGFRAIVTPAELVKRSGRPGTFARGHADRAYVKPTKEPGKAYFIWVELKAQKARTKAARREAQARWQAEQQHLGFLAYRCPDGCADPFTHFRSWFDSQFSGGSING